MPRSTDEILAEIEMWREVRRRAENQIELAEVAAVQLYLELDGAERMADDPPSGHEMTIN
jgi:hypothetical protein